MTSNGFHYYTDSYTNVRILKIVLDFGKIKLIKIHFSDIVLRQISVLLEGNRFLVVKGSFGEFRNCELSRTRVHTHHRLPLSYQAGKQAAG